MSHASSEPMTAPLDVPAMTSILSKSRGSSVASRARMSAEKRPRAPPPSRLRMRMRRRRDEAPEKRRSRILSASAAWCESAGACVDRSQRPSRENAVPRLLRSFALKAANVWRSSR